ncbi:uncharacterized protein LOC135377831 isoform X2 [Ornithodoros turicata]|uniref:uncharacterized protein LOC135377831 isoform X2 n=1 Tax=Ornithodoros turicata TaxID=34597 RepID=UPI003139A16B
METRESIFEQSNLSGLLRSPQATSTARKTSNRCRPCQQGMHSVRNKLFTSTDESPSMLHETTAAGTYDGPCTSLGKPARKDDEKMNSFLEESKQRLSLLVSDTVCRSIVKVLPPTNARNATAKDLLSQGIEEIGGATTSQFWMAGCKQQVSVSQSLVRNPLADASVLDLSQIFKGIDVQDTTISRHSQVSFQPKQISARSTSVSSASLGKPAKPSEMVAWDTLQSDGVGNRSSMFEGDISKGMSAAEFSGFQSVQNVIFPDEEFYTSGLAEEKLKDDEEQFKKDNMFDGLPCEAPCESLQESIGPQDITRPSWINGDGSRVSLGSYIRGRSAPIHNMLSPADLGVEEAIMNETSNRISKLPPSESVQELVLQNLGFDKTFISVCDRSTSDQKLGQTPSCASKLAPDLPPTTLRDDSTVCSLSLSTINNLFGDTSVTEAPGAILQKLVCATKADCSTGKRSKEVAKKKHPLKSQMEESDSDSIFKRPFPVLPRVKPSSTHNACAAGLSHTAPNLCQPRKNLGSEQATKAGYSASPTENVSQSTGTLQKTCEKSSNAAVGDLPNSFVNGCLRTCEWVMKSASDSEVDANSVVKQVPPLPGTPSLQTRNGISFRVAPCPNASTSVLIAQDGGKGECDAGTTSDPNAAQSKAQASLDPSGSRSDSGSCCSAWDHPWTQGNMRVLNAEKRNLSTPSCSSESSGGEGGNTVMVVPGQLNQQMDLDLGCVCVGVLKKAVLTFINPAECIMHYSLKWSESHFSDDIIDGIGFVDVSFPEVVTVNALQSKEVKGTFLSRKPGKVTATIEVQPMQLPSEPIQISLSALVEWPHLRVEVPRPQVFKGIDLDGPDCMGTVVVTNKSSCTVPFKVMIIEGQGSFSLSKNIAATSSKSDHSNAVPVFSSLSAGETSEFTVIFSPRNAKALCCNAKVQIYLSGHYASTELLESLPISASVVCPKLRADEMNEVVHVFDTEEKVITLRNLGRNGLQVEFLSSSPAFAVAPKRAFFNPTSAIEVTVVLVGTSSMMCETPTGALQAVVQPQGIVLDILKLEGKLQDAVNSTVQPAHPLRQPKNKTFILESSKRLLLWSDVPVGQTVTKTIVFRNPSAIPIKANVMIPEHRTSCFKVFVRGESTPCHMVSVCLQPRKSIEISVSFCPTVVCFLQSRLLIRGQSPDVINNSVPLFGFGGKMQVSLLGLNTLGQSGYIVDLGLVPERQAVGREFTVFNAGDWDCFVMFTFAKDAPSLVSPIEEANVSPQCLVLASKESRTVSLSVKASCAARSAGCDDQIVKLGTLKVLHGLEVLRQWARRTCSHSSGTPESILPFLLQFEGERSMDNISLPTSALRDNFLKTVSQTAVILTSGAGTIMMQASSNMSFLPLEDP